MADKKEDEEEQNNFLGTCTLAKTPFCYNYILSNPECIWSQPPSIGPDRGGLIVVEGADATGKTTICKQLVPWLMKCKKKPAALVSFPNRLTEVGKILDSYLTQADNPAEIPPQALHLLFSANRWEMVDTILTAIGAGLNVIVDRYVYSGIAYTTAMDETLFDWCKTVECGLPRPDLVVYLQTDVKIAQKRANFGMERYESPHFQIKVRELFEKMKKFEQWYTVDTDDMHQEEVFRNVAHEVRNALEFLTSAPLEVLTREDFD